jgi:hypothetical protein
MADQDKPRQQFKDGHVPIKKGYEPRKVQGGYVPTSSSAVSGPPKGGSAAMPAKK